MFQAKLVYLYLPIAVLNLAVEKLNMVQSWTSFYRVQNTKSVEVYIAEVHTYMVCFSRLIRRYW